MFDGCQIRKHFLSGQDIVSGNAGSHSCFSLASGQSNTSPVCSLVTNRHQNDIAITAVQNQVSEAGCEAWILVAVFHCWRLKELRYTFFLLRNRYSRHSRAADFLVLSNQNQATRQTTCCHPSKPG